MKILSWLFTLPFVLFCVFFAVNNRQIVTVDLWPFDALISTPLYLISLGGLFIGFLLGATFFWFASLRHSWDKRKLTKEVDKLKTKLNEEKAKPPTT